MTKELLPLACAVARYGSSVSFSGLYVHCT